MKTLLLFLPKAAIVVMKGFLIAQSCEYERVSENRWCGQLIQGFFNTVCSGARKPVHVATSDIRKPFP
jgi:hypothetical protein